MNCLPGLLALLFLAEVCLGDHHHEDDHHHLHEHHGSHHDDKHDLTASLGESAGQLPKCPGICQKTGDCLISLSETDCAEDLICCVDHLQKMAATEFADAELTTESMLDSNLVQEISESEGFPEEMLGVSENVDLTQGGQYQVVYSEESDEAVLDELPEEIVQTASEGICPGSCVSSDLTDTCSYVVSDSPSCVPGTICCITDSIIQQSGGYAEESTIVKRAANNMGQFNCPGTCVHPMHAAQCQSVLNQFSCPLNTKCCVFGANPVPPRVQPTECRGMCVPFRMIGYCVPPNQLVMGPSTCPAGQSCCTRNPKVKEQFTQMTFPSASYVDAESHKDVLGHLAVDEIGTVFKVDNFGHVSPLPRLPLNSNMFELVKLASYPRSDGELVIFADKSGMLYQELYPASRSGTSNQGFMQAPQQQNNFQSEDSEQEVSTDSDIIIPEDDDEVPVTTSKPVDHTDKTSMPPCPGSCMSHFLRFTCFRGHAIYDGFTCPGRSVCCARLKDIEDHEEYLKSLSPYFSTPAAARDPSKNRCGIKGRRDTPRVMGGKDSLPGEWCWQVAVINLQNQYICGGALIDNSWVLTAAHCVIGPMEEAQTIFVRAGVTDLKSSEDNSQSQTIKVLSTYVHHNFNALNLDNNIALLRLQKPVTLNSNVCVVCLPTNRKMPKEGTKCTVTGYGFVSPGGGMSLRIREAQVPIIDDMECMTNVTEALESPFLLPASSFCAGGEGLKDACQGDAGGALACEIGGFHELVGLVSWGLGCGRDFVPSIYVKVPAFMGWINQIISSSSFFTS